MIHGSTDLEFLITDPSGKKTGKPKNKNKVTEDIESTYGYNVDDDGRAPEYFSSKGLEDGVYKVDFFNLKGGKYELDIRVYGSQEGTAGIQNLVKGRLAPQEIDSMEIRIAKDKKPIFTRPRTATEH